jgi:hypothetical protein
MITIRHNALGKTPLCCSVFRRFPASWKAWFALFLCGCAAAVAIAHLGKDNPQDVGRRHSFGLAELLRIPSAGIAELPIERLNLACAAGLCLTNEPDIKECANTLRVWAEHVRSETQRHQYRYERNPAEFENSPGFYRMLMLSVVLAEDYRVQYDPQRIAGPDKASLDDGFFSEPASVFLQGLLGPERVGTCSSMPVLYVAIGRQLGYPLKLVTTKGHLFVRWEGAGERFNIEATAHGLSRFDDDYYRHWPFEITPAEEKAEGYLKSLTPPEELAVFLSVRGMCLRDQGRLAEAAESFAAAVSLAPNCAGYRTMIARLQSALDRARSATALPQKSQPQTTPTANRT